MPPSWFLPCMLFLCWRCHNILPLNASINSLKTGILKISHCNSTSPKLKADTYHCWVHLISLVVTVPHWGSNQRPRAFVCLVSFELGNTPGPSPLFILSFNEHFFQIFYFFVFIVASIIGISHFLPFPPSKFLYPPPGFHYLIAHVHCLWNKKCFYVWPQGATKIKWKITSTWKWLWTWSGEWWRHDQCKQKTEIQCNRRLFTAEIWSHTSKDLSGRNKPGICRQWTHSLWLPWGHAGGLKGCSQHKRPEPHGLVTWFIK